LTTTSSSNKAAARSKEAFEQEAASRNMANLQLRVGELEELKETLRSEIRGLYANLSQQTAKATRLESTCEQQRIELERLEKENAALLQSRQLVPFETAPPSKDAVEDNAAGAMVASGTVPPEKTSATLTASNAPKQPKRVDPAAIAQQYELSRFIQDAAKDAEMAKLRERACAAETQVQMEQDRVQVLEKQLAAREKEAELRQEQFKSRFQMQDENIADLQQQLSSLYVAFELLRQEQSTEEVARLTLRDNLQDADSHVAKHVTQIEKLQLEKFHNSPRPTGGFAGSSPEHFVLNHPRSSESPASVVTNSTIKGAPVHDQSLRSLYSPDAPTILGASEKIMSGVLWKRGKGLIPWKKRFFSLFHRVVDDTFALHYTDGPRQELKGTICYLTRGLSIVTETSEHAPKHPFAFVLHINPFDVHAPVICAAASTREDLLDWMAALAVATTEDTNHFQDGNRNRTRTPTPPLATPESMTPPLAATSPAASTNRDGGDVFDQEAADYEFARRMQNSYEFEV
jgi:predicted  nucleic acid-binding Zn-ribbon protein